MKYVLPILLLLTACGLDLGEDSISHPVAGPVGVSLIVLGNVQDAGSPHIACKKDCCRDLFDAPDPTRQVNCLGLVDGISGQQFLLEATPDLARQAKGLKAYADSDKELPDGILLTHAHIGHYAGLMYLGKEATNADGVPVYAMPRMRRFLTENGPWSQLVANRNISLRPIMADSSFQLSENVRITPFTVPHRDEYSETVGYRIDGPEKSALFIPDIDKWERWDRRIEDLMEEVDYAFLDATFYDAAELNTRDISQIPHPFVSESMVRFSDLAPEEKAKIQFIHFNHTNRLLRKDSEAYRQVVDEGFGIADYGEVFAL